MGLIVDRMYRLSPMLDDPALRRKPVVFKGYMDRVFDIRRAIVRIVLQDGSLGDEWLINPHYVISL